MKELEKRFSEQKWEHWSSKYSHFIEIPNSLKTKILEFIESEIKLAVKEERERIVGVIENYAKFTEEFHKEMIGTCNEDNRTMLAFDAHCRITAVTHILEKIKTKVEE